MRDSKRHIRQQIHRPGANHHAPPTHPLAAILSGLNVAEVLETSVPHYLHNFLHYGPRSFTGKDWAAMLIWLRQTGYHTYQELTLFGVWAIEKDEETTLQIGVRHLHYSAPVYNAESYQQIIRQNFKTYYNDDGRPPQPPHIFFETAYDPARRLALRQEIADALIQGLRRIRR